MTPTMVNGSPFKRTVRPTASRDAPKRVRHSASLITARRSAPTSAAAKVRPNAAGTPRTPKTSGVTSETLTRSAKPSTSPFSVIRPSAAPPIAANARWRDRTSISSAREKRSPSPTVSGRALTRLTMPLASG